ncbi:MAG: DNA/RNA non-specific endonuclease [Rikenellaceae bacterium]
MKKIYTTIIFTLAIACAVAQSYLPQSTGEKIEHNYYTLSYNEEHEQAEWVYYQLTPASLSGTTERTNDFRSDKSVSTGSATLADYVGSGYDRGHLCPAGSMVINLTAMSESFYLSNMSPQNPSFNRGRWKELEEKVRAFAMADSMLHVVTGPLFASTLGSIGESRVTIPAAYYKVLYSPKKGEMIGFMMQNCKLDGPLESYATTIDQIEAISDINFFAHFDDQLATQESTINLDAWDFDGVSTPKTTQVKASQSETSTKKTANSNQCQAITSSGNQCKRTAESGSKYCWQHKK